MGEAKEKRTPPSEHGKCPKCRADLDGDGIWQTFMDRTGDEAKADDMAAHYGATRTRGRWRRAIAVYDRTLDRTIAHRCPDCGHEWGRQDLPTPTQKEGS